ncbi:MAG: hypothetical protein QM608_04145 [Caulobacter sp.]
MTSTNSISGGDVVAPIPANDRGGVLPRLLNAKEAARYLGYETTSVLANIPVKPLVMTATGQGVSKRWDRHAIDRWLDDVGGLTSSVSATAGSAADDAFEKWAAAQ